MRTMMLIVFVSLFAGAAYCQNSDLWVVPDNTPFKGADIPMSVKRLEIDGSHRDAKLFLRGREFTELRIRGRRLPTDLLSEVATQTNLEVLHVYDSGSFEEAIPESLGSLTKLRELRLGEHASGAWLSVIKQFKELETLIAPNLRNAHPDDLAALGDLENLRILELGVSYSNAYFLPVETYSWLAKLTDLEVLRMRGGFLRTDGEWFQYFTAFKTIRELCCESNGNLSDKHAEGFGKMKNLESLTLHGCRMTAKGFRFLAKLKDLRSIDLANLYSVQKGDALSGLAGAKSLESISTSQSFSKQTASKLAKCKKLNTLTLVGYSHTFKGIADWAALKKVTKIVLKNCKFPNAEQLQQFGVLRKLREIVLVDARLDREDNLVDRLTQFKPFKSLERFSILSTSRLRRPILTESDYRRVTDAWKEVVLVAPVPVPFSNVMIHNHEYDTERMKAAHLYGKGEEVPNLDAIKKVRFIEAATVNQLKGIKDRQEVECVSISLTNPINSEWIETLATMTQLRSVELTNVSPKATEGLGKLSALPKLEKLILQRCGTVSADVLSDFKGHEALFALSFEDCDLSDAVIVAMRDCPGLRTLCLRNVRGLSPAGLANLGTVSSLQNIQILDGSVALSGDEFLLGLSKLPKLRQLDMSGGSDAFTDACLAALASCQNLEILAVSSTKFTDSGWAHFKDHPSLRSLHTDVNKGQTGSGLANMPNLESLTVSNSAEGFSDALILAAATNLKLKHFELTGWHNVESPISNDAIKALSALKDLESLHLRLLPNVTDEGLAFLSDCSKLRKIDLYKMSGVRGGFVKSLHSLPHLGFVSLRDCSVPEVIFLETDLVPRTFELRN